MFGGVGIPELILIFLVILLLFGAKRLPEIGSSLGRGIREFKGSLREIEGELKLPQDQPSGDRTHGRTSTPSAPPQQLQSGSNLGDTEAEARDREPRRLFPE
jgi:sec-independent protein translocase protein TatA